MDGAGEFAVKKSDRGIWLFVNLVSLEYAATGCLTATTILPEQLPEYPIHQNYRQ
jgi:hypothetical protein